MTPPTRCSATGPSDMSGWLLLGLPGAIYAAGLSRGVGATQQDRPAPPSRHGFDGGPALDAGSTPRAAPRGNRRPRAARNR
ncbi:hypothetical protein DDE18_21120 [Nocardioides gansuensis]|uniref:Uncharacterized protein n=1 Tax=Nocardioides gansuensis TaxID=2138300 RepID=A0A2T8F5A8_9ACTN|nr:hypothetical protein DDE18_21120 [Nocardioides gansuensis]